MVIGATAVIFSSSDAARKKREILILLCRTQHRVGFVGARVYLDSSYLPEVIVGGSRKFRSCPTQPYWRYKFYPDIPTSTRKARVLAQSLPPSPSPFLLSPVFPGTRDLVRSTDLRLVSIVRLRTPPPTPGTSVKKTSYDISYPWGYYAIN